MALRGRKQGKQLAAAVDRGRRLLVARQDQATFDFLKEAVHEFPADAEIRLLYATSLLAFQPDDVAAEAAKAVELDPDNPRILVRAGNLLLSGGKIEAAKSCADRATELAQPAFVLMSSLWNLNGLLAALAGEDDRAEKDLRAAVAKDPLYSAFAIDLAKFLAARGRKDAAIEVVDEALSHAKEIGELERLRGDLTGKP